MTENNDSTPTGVTTLERIIERRRGCGLRDLTITEQSEILTTGFYDPEKYLED